MAPKKTSSTASYSEYDHPLWEVRRKEILDIDRNQCRRCKSKSKLHVHHLSYHHGRRIWEYDDNELVTLCESCHNEIHRYKDSVSDSLLYFMMQWANKSLSCDYYDIMRILSALQSYDSVSSKIASRMIINDLEILRGE